MMHKSQIDILQTEPQLNSSTTADELPSAKLLPNPLLAAVHSGEITKTAYLRASCRLLEQDWLHFYSDAQLAYYRQMVDAYESVHPNGR